MRARKSPILKPHHESLRFRSALKYTRLPKKAFHSVVFSDESTMKAFGTVNSQVMGEWMPKKGNRTPEQEQQLELTRERNAMVRNVWGAVCYEGKSELVIFTGVLESDFYLKEILKKVAVPFVKRKKMKLFLQDHDPKHTAEPPVEYLDRTLGPKSWTRKSPAPCKKLDDIGRVIKIQKADNNGKMRHYTLDNTFEDCDCEIPRGVFYAHVANSPDLNIMEDVWAWMGAELASGKHPASKNAREFELLLFKLWDELPMTFVRNMIDSMPRRLKEVIKQKGKMTHYYK